MFLFVSYSDANYIDVIEYQDIINSINSKQSFEHRILLPPKFTHSRAMASAYRSSDKTVTLWWTANDLNIKNKINLGRMILTWECQDDVLMAKPSSILWEDAHSETQWVNYCVLKRGTI